MLTSASTWPSFLDQEPDLLGVAQVRRDEPGLAAGLHDLPSPSPRRERCHGRARSPSHPSSASCQRRGPADARRGAGDQRGARVEFLVELLGHLDSLIE